MAADCHHLTAKRQHHRRVNRRKLHWQHRHLSVGPSSPTEPPPPPGSHGERSHPSRHGQAPMIRRVTRRGHGSRGGVGRHGPRQTPLALPVAWERSRLCTETATGRTAEQAGRQAVRGSLLLPSCRLRAGCAGYASGNVTSVTLSRAASHRWRRYRKVAATTASLAVANGARTRARATTTRRSVPPAVWTRLYSALSVCVAVCVWVCHHRLPTTRMNSFQKNCWTYIESRKYSRLPTYLKRESIKNNKSHVLFAAA